jgi:hypothetical protein
MSALGPYRSHHELGAHVATYPFRMATSPAAFALFFVPGPLAAAFVAAEGIALHDGDGHFTVVVLLGILLFVVLPVCGVLAMGGARARRDDRIEVHERGLAVHVEGTATCTPWEDVASLTSTVLGRGLGEVPARLCILQRPEGPLVLTGGFERVEELIETIQARIAEREIPRALEALRAGETRSFGKLTLSRAGVGAHAEVLAWRSFDHVEVHGGTLLICRRGTGGFAREELAKVPNAHVFLALAAKLREEHLAAAPSMAEG